ncbi:glycosyltransferase [Kordiimonas sp. SCSIO 12610]|uniref:glycosyltransferase n=1 Tax=Kordiimonas sp. SCSIO 12610 TaxID=2829597 RepID=UPI00210AF79D|nr:glycosyltransferase [Kordiimonas sp. SCSIO 12610]UTW54160.1 glycosyltransferase [Kordiimonas sp. SCSIO 12610]
MDNKNIKILLFSSLFPHQYEPTLGIFVENRLRHLVATENVEAKVVAPVPYFPFKNKIFGRYGRAGAVPKRELRHDIDIYHPRFLTIPKLGERFNPTALYKSAISRLETLISDGFDFDIIDAHYLYPDGVAAMKLAETLGKPFTLTARGSDVTQIARQDPVARQQILEAIDKSYKTITVSSSLREELIQQGADPEKITVLRNGVDTDRFFPQERDKIRNDLNLTGNTMIYAGWLIARKRLDIVLEVTLKIPDLTTLIVGEGPERDKLEQQANALGIMNRAVFLGQKKPEEMAKYYSSADVLLLPSDREGWANVLLEAQACGTPVVTRDVGAAGDIVTNQNVGRIVEGDDPMVIAQSVQSLLSSNVDRNLVREHACKYSWDATSLGQYEIFRDAVS